MKLEQSFEVAAPVERVWKALIDVEHFAPCLPGAVVTGRNADGTYNGTFTVKIGPTTASYTGKLEMEKIDEAARTATMQAHGTDKRGQGGAKATIVSTLSPANGDGTRVEVVTDLHITGRLARFGRAGMIEDISERVMQQFATRLQASLVGARAGIADAGRGDTQPLGEVVPAPGASAADEARAAVDGGEHADAEAAGEVEGGERVSAGADAATNGGQPPGAEASESASESEWAPEPSEPIQGLSLVSSVVWGRLRRNPLPVLGLMLGFLFALELLRRRRVGRREA
jgi:carbon monoxide dehydrogenase subunit G